MTCIAAATDGVNVAMAADALAVGPCGQTVEISKLLRFGDALVGVAGRAASIPVLRRKLEPGEPEGNADEWAQDVAEKATVLLISAGLVDRDDEHQFYGTLLLAWGGRIWEIESGMALPMRRGYHAVGSGDEVAMGALSVIHGAAGHQPLDWQVRRAVEAAAEHKVDVGGQIDVLTA